MSRHLPLPLPLAGRPGIGAVSWAHLALAAWPVSGWVPGALASRLVALRYHDAT